MGRVMIVVVDCQTDVNARRIITSVGDFLFKHGVVTWCRVISLLAVAAAVATECSQAGHTQLIPAVVAAVTDVIERHAASWISQQGGWVCRIIFSTSCVESQCCVSVRHIVVRPATSCFADWSKRRHVTEHYRMTDDSRSRSRDNWKMSGGRLTCRKMSDGRLTCQKIFNVKRTPSREKCQETRGHEFEPRPISKPNVIFCTLFLFTFCFVFLFIFLRFS